VDPITDLICFPDFRVTFPHFLRHSMHSSKHLVLAIGDVDDMKRYVEHESLSEEVNFGHVAGCALMSDLGVVAKEWLTDLPSDWIGAVSTFGGDEIIIALLVTDPQEFLARLYSLSFELGKRLPCTVSFAARLHATQDLDPDLDSETLAITLLAEVDRALFKAKRDRRSGGNTLGGFVEVVAPLAEPRRQQTSSCHPPRDEYQNLGRPTRVASPQ
jgi:GGDEF domain-containing protein